MQYFEPAVGQGSFWRSSFQRVVRAVNRPSRCWCYACWCAWESWAMVLRRCWRDLLVCRVSVDVTPFSCDQFGTALPVQLLTHWAWTDLQLIVTILDWQSSNPLGEVRIKWFDLRVENSRLREKIFLAELSSYSPTWWVCQVKSGELERVN